MAVGRAVARHRSEEGKRQVRRAMMAAAGELLLEKGYAGFSLREVARRAGYTPGNVYLYFKDKNDLLYQAIESGFYDFGERLERAAVTTAAPLERVLALGRAYVEFGLEHPVLYELMFVQRTDYLFAEGRPVPGLDKLEHLGRAVEEAMTAGAIREGDVLSLTDALWAATHGVVSLSLAMPFIDKERSSRMAEAAFRMIASALRRP